MAKSKSDNNTDAKAGGEKKVSQVVMVRTAIEELGEDAKPQAIQDHIKTRFNKELAPTIISNYKSVLKRKNGGARRGNGGGIKVEDLQALRGLVNRLGQDQVQQLIKVFAE